MHLQQITRYPLKSCRGTDLDHAWLGSRGVSSDRELILSEPDGRFITARSEPALLQLQLSPNQQGWLVEHPRLGALQINHQTQDRGEVAVWGRRISAPRLTAAELWFTELLGREVRLFVNSDARDLAEKRYRWGPIFSDGYPLLVCTTASLEALNQASGERFEMSRFRANLVIENQLPWEEDDWSELAIGETRLKRQKPCERCVLITRHPETGEKHPRQEPLRTLAQLHCGASGEVLFGQNFSVLAAGEVRVGDPVALL